MPANLDDLRALVRRLHVHYDVEPELELRDGARVRTALLVRVWGVHAKGARALPGCAKCRELGAHLQLVAEYALDGEPPVPAEIEPLRKGLYDSRVVPGTDEVALPIRITSRGGSASPSGREERCLKGIRARLRRLGVPER